MPWQFKGIFLIVFHYFWQHPSPPLSFNSSPYLHRPKEQRGKKALCLGAYCDHEWDTHWPNHHGILKQDSSVGGFNFFNNNCKSSWEEGTLWIRRSQFPPVLKTAVPSGLTASHTNSLQGLLHSPNTASVSLFSWTKHPHCLHRHELSWQKSIYSPSRAEGHKSFTFFFLFSSSSSSYFTNLTN